jgi:hypothetical protein
MYRASDMIISQDIRVPSWHLNEELEFNEKLLLQKLFRFFQCRTLSCTGSLSSSDSVDEVRTCSVLRLAYIMRCIAS